MTQSNASAVRRFCRAAALVPAVAVLTATAPALADRPETWADPDPVGTLWPLILLVGIPLGLFALIALLVYVPSMARGQQYTPGLAWRNENEWFGGPRGGVEATDTAEPAGAQDADEHDRGGASARW